MLDSCVPRWSCGTYYSMWTNDKMPEDIGVEKTVHAYYTSGSPCEYNYNTVRGTLQVMRCSWNTRHDLVYKFIPKSYSNTCQFAFCGME